MEEPSEENLRQLRTLMAQEFMNAQRSAAGHRKVTASLMNIQEQAAAHGMESNFNETYALLMNRTLVVKKNETSADLLVRLTQSFTSKIQAKYAEEEDEDGTNICVRYVEFIIRHFLKGIDAKNSVVRYRCCQFIYSITNVLNDMSEELCEELKHKMDLQLYDQQPYVRMCAALTMVRLQDDPNDIPEDTFSVTSHLVQVLRHDPSAEVRRAVLVNLDPTRFTIPKMLERALDTNLVNRRVVYSRVMSTIGDFRFIKIKHREKLLKWGLKDRDLSVRKAATKMLLEQWLTNVDNNVLEILERIDITNSVEVGETTINVILANKPDIANSIKLTDEQWYNLTPELAFLIRTANAFFIKEKKTANVEKLLPELSGLCTALEHYINLLFKLDYDEANMDDENDEHFKKKMDMEFIVEQIFIVIETYDFGDEIGRRNILAVIRDSITNLKFSSPQLFSRSVAIIRKLSVKESDFSQVIVELLSDMNDRLEENLEAVEDEEKKVALTLGCHTRCLCLLQSTLEFINLPLERNNYLSSVLTSTVIPAIHSMYPELRLGGLKCLALYCLISRKLAAEKLELFGKAFLVGDHDIKGIVIKALTDILMVHGKTLVDNEECNVDMRSLYKLYYKAFGSLDDKNEEEEESDEDRELQAIACFALCKLMVNGIFDDPLILQLAVLMYFSNQSSVSAQQCQQLSYCLPVFCFSSADHQQLMADITVDSLKRLVRSYNNMPANVPGMLNPTQIAAQFIDWTNPAKVVVKSKETGQLVNNGGNSNIHLGLANSMLERLTDGGFRSKEECRALCLSFGKLNIPDTVDLQDLEETYDLVSKIVKEKLVKEALLKNALIKFEKELDTRIGKIYEKKGENRHGHRSSSSNSSRESSEAPQDKSEPTETEEDQVTEAVAPVSADDSDVEMEDDLEETSVVTKAKTPAKEKPSSNSSTVPMAIDNDESELSELSELSTSSDEEDAYGTQATKDVKQARGVSDDDEAEDEEEDSEKEEDDDE